MITSEKEKTYVHINEYGELQVIVSLKDVHKFKVAGLVRYSDFEARGDDETDDKDGHMVRDAPIIWDYNQIMVITALPIDEKTLSITGGRFTTIANKASFSDSLLMTKDAKIDIE